MEERCDLLIVGGGLTGLFAAYRALAKGLRVTLVAASPGSLPYMSGALDFLGVHPTAEKAYRVDPWQALEELVREESGHPYALMGVERTRAGWEEFTSLMAESRLRYGGSDYNRLILTCAGTLKPTHLLPVPLEVNARAFEERADTLLLGFERFVDFSPEQVLGVMGERWPGLRAARVDLGEALGRRPGAMALATEFEREGFRDAFCEKVRELVQGASYLGLPAVLGFGNAAAICDDLSERLGARVFEVPLVSPSVPGLRLGEFLRQVVLEKGCTIRRGRPISRLEVRDRRVVFAEREGTSYDARIIPEQVILATGRFLGGGLVAEAEASGAAKAKVKESLLGLPVEAPEAREQWHMGSFLGAPGHPINRCGVRTDQTFRPLNGDGQPALQNLRVAGTILAGQDWVREKSGAGISVTTAFAAVEAMTEDQ